MNGQPYQLLPNLTIDEYEALRDSIREHGVLVPVEVDEDGLTLDGHHRLQACEELGIECPTVVRTGLDDAAKVAHVLTLNLDRRQLDREQRTELVKQLRHRRMSIRAIADVVKVSPATVHADLAGVQDRTPDPKPVVGRDGKAYKPTRPRYSQADRAQILDVPIETIVQWDAEAEPAVEVTADPPANDVFKRLVYVMQIIEKLDLDACATGVPKTRQATTAKRLRKAGGRLGEIAWKLEVAGRHGGAA